MSSSQAVKQSSIRLCRKCGFILDTRPDLREVDGVCIPCINSEKKKEIDFKARQEWLTNYIKENKTNSEYDCLVGVSGGKDSTTIVRKLFENHGVKKALLYNFTDEFTHTQAGKHNLDNLVKRYNCDLLVYRMSPDLFIEHVKQDFINELHPLKRIEAGAYSYSIKLAKMYNIKLIFFGENPAFEYGSSNELDIFRPLSSNENDVEIIYMGAIYPYSAVEWYKSAQEVGFRDLDYYNEWQRQGNIENYSQIDSIGYLMQIWTKFVKYGFQRVSDIACRLVREGLLSYEKAQEFIRDKDYICDSASKRDFCSVIGITESYFDEVVDKFANKDILIKDKNGLWRRKDLYSVS